MDLCELNDNHYMMMMDYNTKFSIVRQIEDESSATVMGSIKSVLSEHGNIKEPVSDGSPCFKSHEFDKFVQSYGIVHTMISLHNYQSYGMAERCIRTIKELIRKNKDS